MLTSSTLTFSEETSDLKRYAVFDFAGGKVKITFREEEIKSGLERLRFEAECRASNLFILNLEHCPFQLDGDIVHGSASKTILKIVRYGKELAVISILDEASGTINLCEVEIDYLLAAVRLHSVKHAN